MARQTTVRPVTVDRNRLAGNPTAHGVTVAGNGTKTGSVE
jgi:hypothetical protein